MEKSRHIYRIIKRRDFLAGTLAGMAGLALSGHSTPSWATIATSVSFPENESLSADAVQRRFEHINGTYGVGAAFSDSDVDFVLRYAAPFPGTSKGILATMTPNHEGFSARAYIESSYVGSFSYRCLTTTWVENCTDMTACLAVAQTLTAYGWISPYQGPRGMCNYGIVYRTPAEVRPGVITVDAHDKGFAESVDQIVGIVNACHCGITVCKQ